MNKTSANEYAVINVTDIQKRIEELEKEKEISENNQETTQVQIQYWLISELKQVLSQSTPLIPEIEKAFTSGCKFQNAEHKSWESYNKFTGYQQANNELNVNDYIANLKLDI